MGFLAENLGTASHLGDTILIIEETDDPRSRDQPACAGLPRRERTRAVMRPIVNYGMRLIALATITNGLAPTTRAADGAGPRDEAGAGPVTVTVLATPGGGIQPQAAIDPAGVIHLISFQGPPGGG